MTEVEDFFSLQNTVENISEQRKSQIFDYLAPIKALAKISCKSIYLIDYHKKGFDFVSDHPLFLCGKTADEVKNMGYQFYLKYVIKSDIDLLLRINKIGFDFYDKIPLNEKRDYSISYDFHIRNQEGKEILVNHKLTPLFLSDDGKIWKAICIVSLSRRKDSGNIEILKERDNKLFSYNLDGNYWSTSNLVQLNEREKEILSFSGRGFTVNEIAKRIFVSPDTVKFHRKKMFEKLDVSNISEAIAYSANNKLI